MKIFNINNKMKDKLTFRKRSSRVNRINKVNQNVPRGGIRL